MDKGYQKFLRLAIDLASVGMEQRGQPPSYFCTPKGASTIGWTGVDMQTLPKLRFPIHRWMAATLCRRKKLRYPQTSRCFFRRRGV